ncbi:hypothetical protein M405DRAFT_450203 [Rhizopogon salebrosus TDB-379]|nr:hypothetical protein M405DRAFT_450203 [Rhizopogon salebrosus TDB-379]
MLNRAYKGIIRICLAEIFSSCQPEVASWNEGQRTHNNTDIQAKPQTPVAHNETIHLSTMPQPSDHQHLQCQQYDVLSREPTGMTSILPGGADLFGQPFPGGG